MVGWPLPKQRKITDDKNPHTKHTKNNKCWQGCGEVRTPVHFWWIVKCKTEVLKIKKNKKQKTKLPYDPAILLLCIYSKELEMGPQVHALPHSLQHIHNRGDNNLNVHHLMNGF